MTGAPRFDESLAQVARSLHLPAVTLLGMAGAVALFAWLERRGRDRWQRVAISGEAASRGPYRSGGAVTSHLLRAPGVVRGLAFGSLAFAHVFGPLLVLALVGYPFDGIAIPLIPGLGLVVLNGCCAWLLLGRSPHAASTAHAGARGSLMANVGLLGIAALHFYVVELQRREGLEHACSSSVTFVVIVFAVASIAQALLTLAALRAHGDALRGFGDPVGAR